MPSVHIVNPKGSTGNRTSLNRARRYVKQDRAIWVSFEKTIKFVDRKPMFQVLSVRGPRGMQPARFIITPEMKRSTDLRAAVPMWPTAKEIKEREEKQGNGTKKS